MPRSPASALADDAAIAADLTDAATDPAPLRRRKRGFGAMSPEQQRAIASLGGKASHAPAPGRKLGHQWTREAAREAGRRGGLASRGGRGRIVET